MFGCVLETQISRQQTGLPKSLFSQLLEVMVILPRLYRKFTFGEHKHISIQALNWILIGYVCKITHIQTGT